MKIKLLPHFPNTVFEPFLLTSPQTPNYNCIAWAFEDPSRVYWPGPPSSFYWPDDVPREENIQAFIRLFEKKGYFKCHNGDLEQNFQKIAIFVNNKGCPTHAARQLDNGRWTSKLGPSFDVEHTIFSIENGAYGVVSVYMKRSK